MLGVRAKLCCDWLDSGDLLLYLLTATSDLIPCTGTQSYSGSRADSICGILMQQQGIYKTSSERLEEHGGQGMNS